MTSSAAHLPEPFLAAGTSSFADFLAQLDPTLLPGGRLGTATMAPFDAADVPHRLAALLRANLGMAMQGLAVVPLFAGYDVARGYGRIFSYDVTGGRYEEHHFHAVGSGSMFARGSLKKLYRPDMNESAVVTAVVESLYDAADDDSATGGPDLYRAIYPIVAVIDANGVRMLDAATMASVVGTVVGARSLAPDGPVASLPPGTGI